MLRKGEPVILLRLIAAALAAVGLWYLFCVALEAIGRNVGEWP